MKILLLISAIFIIFNIYTPSFSALQAKQDSLQSASSDGDIKEYAGELFGIKVPAGNYYFVRAAVLLFGSRWGTKPSSEKEIEELAWEQLLLSFVAFNENVSVTQEEVDDEITKMLSTEKISFDWKKEKDTYGKWIKERTGITPEVFAGQIRHLLQLQKLRGSVIARFKEQMTVNDEEAFIKFLNEYHTLSVELAQFDSKEEADVFYKKISNNKKIWDKQMKKNPEQFKRPGFVSLEFLIDLWGVPRDGAYEMMKKEREAFYPSLPIYKGYAVFKILEKRTADEAAFTTKKDNYIEKVKAVKANEAFISWITELKEKANITVYSSNKSKKNKEERALGN